MENDSHAKRKATSQAVEDEDIIPRHDGETDRDYMKRMMALIHEQAKKREEAEKKLTEEAKKREEEAKKREEEAKKRDEAEKKLAEEREKREQAENLRNGTYYTTFEMLWKATGMTYSGNHMHTFQRTIAPHFRTKDKSQPLVYSLTLKNAFDKSTFVKDDGKSARTSHNREADKRRIWPCDVLGNDYSPPQVANIGNRDVPGPVDITCGVSESLLPAIQEAMVQFVSQSNFRAPDSEKQVVHEDIEDSIEGGEVSESETYTVVENGDKIVHGEIAHLVPASPLHASLYFNVAKWVFGISGSVDNHEAIQKSIHGCCTSQGSTGRLAGTGMKHFVSNKIRLSGQRAFFDNHPNVLIIPIVSMDFLLNTWNGQGYDALFIVGDRNVFKCNLKAIVQGVRLVEAGPVAMPEEIDTGRKLLQNAVLSLAESLYQSYKRPPKCLETKHKALIKTLYGGLASLGEKTALVPIANMNPASARVRKITLVDQVSPGHPAPDPLLLLVKAAINWSHFHNFKLLAAGEVPDEVDEASLAAEADFLDWQESARKVETDQDVLGMTIGVGASS